MLAWCGPPEGINHIKLTIKMQTAMLLLTLMVCCVALAIGNQPETSQSSNDEFWKFEFESGDGRKLVMNDFRANKAILIVNVASKCAFTDANYRQLQTLYDKYHAQGLEILAFPSNQFHQELDNNDEIVSFAQQKYQAQFPLLAKVDVNGEQALPLFKFLQTKLPGFLTNSIKWNFTKFLVVNGTPFKRYGTTTSPLSIEQDIAKALESLGEATSTTALRNDL